MLGHSMILLNVAVNHQTVVLVAEYWLLQIGKEAFYKDANRMRVVHQVHVLGVLLGE